MTVLRGRVRTEPSHKRVRAYLAGDLVVDTTDALYVWEHPPYPQYYLPLSDVVRGRLERTATTSRSPALGVATHYTLRAGEREAADAAWSYLESPVETVRDRVRFEWRALDAWFEEDEEVFVHPRSPDTRVQILPSSRHVTVEVDGVLVADTRRPMFLHETHLPRRTYIPKLDVRMELLTPTASLTMCPYKGTASYWTLVTPRRPHPDIAWSYPAPFRESAPIAGLIAFYDERVDLTVDGVRQPRPKRRTF